MAWVSNSHAGIDRSRVEDMEVRLKQDILREAAAFNNAILVKHENEDLSLFDYWEPVTQSDVQTPCEVYAELRGKRDWRRLGLARTLSTVTYPAHCISVRCMPHVS